MISRCTIRRALSDPNLLGKALSGDSWAPWRTLLIAAMGEELTEQERVTFKALTGREHAPSQRVNELVLVCGRKAGKTKIMALLAVYLATLVDHRLAVGERGVILAVAQSQAVAKVLLRYAEGIIRQSPLLRSLIANCTQDTIELDNGIVIEVRPCNYKSLRGPTYIAALADEAAFWFVDAEAANPDTEVIAAIKPALGMTHGPLIIASSPYAKKGVLWDRYRGHYGANGDPLILVAQAPTRVLNPLYPQATVDAALNEDYARNAAEFLAEFRGDLESFVDRETLEACVTFGCRERAPIQGTRYYGFLDSAGGSGTDSMVVGVGHREDGIVIVDCLRERRPPFSPQDCVEEFSEVLKSYSISKIVSDRWGGDWPGEKFRERGVSCETAAKPKSDLYRELLPAVNSRKIDLLDHPRAISQLCALERRVSRGGRDSIDHPPNGHDDLANCIAGLFSLAKYGGRYRYPSDMNWVR